MPNETTKKATSSPWPKSTYDELMARLEGWPPIKRPEPRGSSEDVLFAACAYRDILLMVDAMRDKAELTGVGGGAAMPPN